MPVVDGRKPVKVAAREGLHAGDMKMKSSMQEYRKTGEYDADYAMAVRTNFQLFKNIFKLFSITSLQMYSYQNVL